MNKDFTVDHLSIRDVDIKTVRTIIMYILSTVFIIIAQFYFTNESVTQSIVNIKHLPN